MVKMSNLNKKLIVEINQIRENNNFRTLRKRIGDKKLKEFINSIYPKFSIKEIEIITGIPDSTLQYWFKELKILFVRNHITNISFPGKMNSQIVIKNQLSTNKVSTIKITPELAYVIGFALGDGSIQKYQVELFNQDRKLKSNLFKYLKNYGTITENERDDGLWRLRLSNGKIANLIKNEKDIRKDTIDYIFKSRDLAKKFIAAFWDAEGSVLRHNNYFHIYLYNSHDYIINKICAFFKLNNIKFSVLERKTRDKDCILNNRLVKSNKMLKRISIPKSSSLAWVKLIGINLLHSKKRDIINEILDIYGGKQNE